MTNKNSLKKPYKKPELKKYGSVHELTQAMSMGTSSDAMGLMTCITPAPQIEEHRFLLTDTTSQNAFREAIKTAVQPGDVVLDLGTGSGLHAFFACQAGAKKVYAVDAASILEVARETSELNGFSDRIEFIFGLAEDVELPEKVDVIITNIGFLNTLEILPEVARKHLKPGGRLVPSALELQFCLVSAPIEFKERIEFWEKEKFGLNFSAFKKMASNHPLYTYFEPNQLLSSPKSLGKIDLLNLKDYFIETDIALKANSKTVAHGLGGWYRFWADNQVLMTTEPPINLTKDIWSEIFLPFETPLELQQGETIKFQVGMYTRGSNSGPIWRWRAWRGDQLIMDQCSFYATPLNKQYLEKIDPLQ